MARELSSWLSGPEPSRSGTPNDEYPGHRLGLPESGPGSIARFGRRLGAILVDWLIAVGLAALFVAIGLGPIRDLQTTQFALWFVIGVAAVRLFGFTPGQFLLGLSVLSVDNRKNVGLGRAFIRNFLIVLVIPALFTDSDQRSLSDLATKTAVVRR